MKKIPESIQNYLKMYVPIYLIFVGYKYRESGIENGYFDLIIVRINHDTCRK